MNLKELIHKYNIPVPRYTSYPTVPFWDNTTFDTIKWKDAVFSTFNSSNSTTGISIYIHLPYCDKLCHYCACTKVVTQNHKVEKSYIKALLYEWDIYLSIFNKKAVLKELHLGGGTPTFFSAKSLYYLVNSIRKSVYIHPDFEFSFEANPNNTNNEQLATLYYLGARRLSIGIQDFDSIVQQTVNRIETYAKVKQLVDKSREIGYESINCDLIYGLPKQKLCSIDKTFSYIKKIKPERIAFYSYAHVPWKSKKQRIFNEIDIPTNFEKRKLYEKGKQHLHQIGYKNIGMDHFALPRDNLFKAYKEKKLHRNFMGYTASSTKLLIGLGISAISDAANVFIQNTKNIDLYKKYVAKGHFNHIKSHYLTIEDIILKKAIQSIACQRELKWTKQIEKLLPKKVKTDLQQMCNEKIIKFTKNGFVVTDFGMVFLRNICSLFDVKLFTKNTDNKVFSTSI